MLRTAKQQIKNKLQVSSNIFACCLIAGGVIFLYAPTQTVSSDDFLTIQDTFSNSTNALTTKKHEVSKIVIPAIGLDLSVKTGTYDPTDQTWTINQTDVFSAINSENLLIYGHNTPTVFKNLSELKSGDMLHVSDTNNIKYSYTFTEQGIVRPENVAIFDYDKPRVIHLMTCTGNRNELRRILRFELVQSS